MIYSAMIVCMLMEQRAMRSKVTSAARSSYFDGLICAFSDNYIDLKEDSPVWQHILLIARFFIFKCLLSAADVFTDILTAKHFFETGNYYWGICTVLPLFAPFVARVIQTLIQVAMCIKSIRHVNDVRLEILLQELPNLVWTFPLLQQIR